MTTTISGNFRDGIVICKLKIVKCIMKIVFFLKIILNNPQNFDGHLTTYLKYSIIFVSYSNYRYISKNWRESREFLLV